MDDLFGVFDEPTAPPAAPAAPRAPAAPARATDSGPERAPASGGRKRDFDAAAEVAAFDAGVRAEQRAAKRQRRTERQEQEQSAAAAAAATPATAVAPREVGEHVGAWSDDDDGDDDDGDDGE